MTAITNISVPADQFALGRLLDDYPEIAIELERLVPLRAGVNSLVWVEETPPEAIEATVRADPLTEDVQQLTEIAGRLLFEIRWRPAIAGVVQPLIESGADVLRAERTGDRWTFRLQFRDRTQLATFHECCQDNDVELQLTALYNPSMPGTKADD